MFIKKSFKIGLPVQVEQNIFYTKGSKCVGTQNGFTLIEIIVTLVLVGILSAIGGMGIVQAVKGYMTVKQNSEITQKYQMAMSRINKEIKEMINIPSSATSTSIPITGTGNCYSATDCVRTIGLVEVTEGSSTKRYIKLASGSSTTLPNGDILLDNVSSFNITYYKQSTPYSTWSAGNDRDLSGVKVDISLDLPGGGTFGGSSFGGSSFPFNVAPRNNGNLGGVTPPTTIVNPPTGWGISCFVATAAYGDSNHPMVQILRDFRDQQLTHWPGGKWFIKQYYVHGPAAADMIRNRPVAMWVARCMLAPFVALAFCLMYAPLAIIFIFFVSFIITIAVFSAFRRKFIPSSVLLRSRGSILLGIIVTMVIMAFLAAAMLPMFSSSLMNQAYADQGRKAYYLAESGFTYAALQYREASSDAAKEAALTEMNGKTYTLDKSGSFKNKFYPYWFKTTAVGSDISTQTPAGYVASEFSSLSGGNIRVCTTGSTPICGDYSYTSTDAVTDSDNTLTFYGISKISGSAAVSGADVQPLVYSNNGTTTVENGGDITINSTGASAFPEFNGTFTMDPLPSGLTSGLVFRYQKRVGSKLYNITLADPRKIWHDFTAPNTTKIVLNKFLVMSSTGKSPSGFEREVKYNTPVGASSGGWNKQQFLTKDMSGFPTDADKTMGTHVVSGGKMQVTSVIDPTAITSGGLAGWVASVIKSFLSALRLMPTPGVWGAVGWDWSNTNTNLAQAYSDAGGALSYDIQVKIDNSTKKYFMNGIGFRLRNNSGTTDSTKDAYGYGVSILRQRQTACANTFVGTCGFNLWSSNWGSTLPGSCLESSGAEKINDGIPDELRPLTSYSGEEQIWCNPFGAILFGVAQYARYSDPVIVLWQRNGPAASQGGFKLLAYRIIEPGDGLMNGNWKDTSATDYVTPQNLRLKPWVTLMVRVNEGYELSFNGGRVDAFNKHFKYGQTIMDSTGNKTARIVGTPVMSTAWGAAGSSSGVGKLVLTNVTGGGFTSGDSLLILGGDGSSYGTASAAQTTSKANYIMVYYSNNKTPVDGDTVQANNTRIGNVLYTTETQANWPPDDQTDATAGLPTATPAGNDYFSLVQWHYITPGSNQVSASGAWTLGSGWSSTSTPTLSRVESFGPYTYLPVNTGWTFVGGDWDYSGGVRHSYAGLFDNNWGKYAQYNSFTSVSGVSYQSSITIGSRNGSGSARYYIGDATVSISGSSPYVTDFNGSSQAPKFECTGWWGGTITEWKTRPRVPPGTATIPLLSPLTAGTIFDTSITVSAFTGGGYFYYTIGNSDDTIVAYTSPHYSANGTYAVNNITIPSSVASAGYMHFYSSDPASRFTIGSISVIPDVFHGTLDTTADSQGNGASYVDAVAYSDFYQAVIKTGALISPTGSTYTDFTNGGGDGIALLTSSYAGAGTFYDDFAVQLDTKVGVGFLPPIQE